MKRAAAWHSASIHTEREVDRKGSRLDRINRGVALVLASMRRGATLHRTNRPNTTSWKLSNGTAVSNEVARALIAGGNVVGVGDSLFECELSQTWRYVEQRR
jgi:hypothetical protein